MNTVLKQLRAILSSSRGSGHYLVEFDSQPRLLRNRLVSYPRSILFIFHCKSVSYPKGNPGNIVAVSLYVFPSLSSVLSQEREREREDVALEGVQDKRNKELNCGESKKHQVSRGTSRYRSGNNCGHSF